MRFLFSPPAEEAAGLLSLPWAEPLEDWDEERMVEIRQRGIHRHVVRFVADDGGLYAPKRHRTTGYVPGGAPPGRLARVR